MADRDRVDLGLCVLHASAFDVNIYIFHFKYHRIVEFLIRRWHSLFTYRPRKSAVHFLNIVK
jgi:hypothetical protein